MPRSTSSLAENELAIAEPNGSRLIVTADPECAQHIEAQAQGLLALAAEQGFSEANIQLIEKALRFSIEAHSGDSRKSGEPYLVHPLEVANILADMQLDVSCVTTGLLHDIVEDTNIPIDTI